MPIRFDGRVAIVTGAGGGLGREHALLLARSGAKVLVNDPGATVNGTAVDRSVAQRVVDEIRAAGGEATANQDSVAEASGAERMVRAAVETYGRLDILVNNAGILRDKSFAKMNLEDFNMVMDVHLKGTVNCTKAAWTLMNEQRYGRIVVTTSVIGYSGGFGQSNYGAAKMAVLGFMNCLAREGAKNNVLINAIAPSAVTRMTQTLVAPEHAQHMRADLISPAVAWLCSEQCAETALIISAIAGFFSRVQMFESQGVQFDPRQPVTPEMVAQAFPRFGRMEQAKPVDPSPVGDLDGRLRALGLLA
jgi:NAD(P)-dependent dehydrogenase (short-subunit alcohol dehydrogenase family)